MKKNNIYTAQTVHCRTGSLEKKMEDIIQGVVVHCRTGSLEISTTLAPSGVTSSLPHRQLRNGQGTD